MSVARMRRREHWAVTAAQRRPRSGACHRRVSRNQISKTKLNGSNLQRSRAALAGASSGVGSGAMSPTQRQLKEKRQLGEMEPVRAAVRGLGWPVELGPPEGPLTFRGRERATSGSERCGGALLQGCAERRERPVANARDVRSSEREGVNSGAINHLHVASRGSALHPPSVLPSALPIPLGRMLAVEPLMVRQRGSEVTPNASKGTVRAIRWNAADRSLHLASRVSACPVPTEGP